MKSFNWNQLFVIFIEVGVCGALLMLLINGFSTNPEPRLIQFFIGSIATLIAGIFGLIIVSVIKTRQAKKND